MKRLALVGFPDGLARQDITPTFFVSIAEFRRGDSQSGVSIDLVSIGENDRF